MPVTFAEDATGEEAIQNVWHGEPDGGGMVREPMQRKGHEPTHPGQGHHCREVPEPGLPLRRHRRQRGVRDGVRRRIFHSDLF